MGMAIAWGGLLCGVLDIAYAFIVFGMAFHLRPERLLQGIAAGLLGRSAIQGGLATAVLGLLLHFVISFAAASIYCLASRKLQWMLSRTALSGALFGAAVYFFMNFVVIPLSAIGMRPINPKWLVINLIEHMLLVGPPIALAAHRFLKPTDASALGARLHAAQSV